MRGSFYFVDNGGAELYFETIFRSYWTEGKDISDDDCLASVVKELGVNPKEFLDFINDETVKSRLIKNTCLLYTSPSPRDGLLSRMPSSA